MRERERERERGRQGERERERAGEREGAVAPPGLVTCGRRRLQARKRWPPCAPSANPSCEIMSICVRRTTGYRPTANQSFLSSYEPQLANPSCEVMSLCQAHNLSGAPCAPSTNPSCRQFDGQLDGQTPPTMPHDDLYCDSDFFQTREKEARDKRLRALRERKRDRERER